MIDTAVLGGAFDPVHTEHVNIVGAAVAELGLSRVVLVPTNNPPHKSKSGVSFEHRVKMLELAFADFPVKIEISDIEARSNEIHYAADVIPELRSEYGGFYYLLGADSLLKLETWHNPADVIGSTPIAVFNRKGYRSVTEKIDELNRRYGGRITELKYVGQDASSSEFRARLNLKMPTDELPHGVFDYIAAHDLYNDYADITYKLPNFLSAKRLEHTKNVVVTAVAINSRCGLKLPYDKVFTAAALHDIGKHYDYNDHTFGKFDIPRDSISTPVQHQFVGAALANIEFKITDEDVLNAIRYHTTGRADMSLLEKLIYVADMVSTERDYVAVDDLRAAVFEDFQSGFIKCVEYSWLYLKKYNRNIYPLTTQAVAFYKENL